MFLHEGPADDATHARTAGAGESAPLAAPAAIAADSELPRIDPARTAETRVPAPDAAAATADDARFGKLLVKATWERDRSPAANVTLFLYVWGRADSYLFLPEARTDAQGLATFDRLEPGHFLVVGDRSGQARGAVAAGTTTEVALTLEKGVELAGEVVDARGEGVADAAIWLGFDGNQSDHGTVVARSDGHGRFVVASVTGYRNVGARKSGFAPSIPQFVSGTPGTTVRVRLELAARGGLVRGRIVDPDDRPVAGAIVQLGDEGRRIERPGTLPCEMLLLTRSDADGRFEFDGAMAGEQPLAVRARELAPWSGRVVVNPDVPADVGITLPRGATLEGRVVDAKQQPVGSAVVSLAGPCRLLATQRESAPDGAYRIDHVAPGTFEVRAELEGKSRAMRAQFTFVDGATVHWDPALASALTLHGRVVDGDGHALAKYWVAVEGAGDADRGDWFSNQATSDAAGRFTVEGCPATEVTVTAHPPAGMSVAATLEHVRVTDAELVVTVTSDRLCSVFLQGVVVGDDGQPIENATIVPHERGARTAPILPTDPRTGRFRIGPFAPGEFHLTAQAAGYAERFVAVGPLRKDETRDLGTIRLERGAPMTIRIHDEAGRVPEGFSLAVRAAGTDRSPRSAFAGGVVAVERACPGRYELLASAPGFVPLFREIVVENDKPVDLDLTLRAGRAVTLRATFSTQLRESIGRDGSRAALVLRDASGTTLARFMIGPQGDPAMMPWIHAVALLSGRHTLDLVVDDEATASVAFEVENDAAFDRPIELEFD
jgi:protocatechuate 3,4-dioxygenase beta subunit